MAQRLNLGNPAWFRLVADSGTPAPLQQYAGRHIALPDGMDLPDGIPAVVIVNGIEVNGYARTVNGAREWLMTAPDDPVAQALDSIPGAGGWSDEMARTVYAQNGGGLLKMGVPLLTVRDGFRALYQAAMADLVAKGWTPPPPPDPPA